MDGLQRLGAERALSQLAMDLEVSADHVAKPARSRKRSPEPLSQVDWPFPVQMRDLYL